jgi:multicomponent K+:H+ antiporter subunit G
MIDTLVALLLVTGAAFTAIGSIGLLRMPNVFMRLHGSSKATTIGIGCILLASALHFGGGELQVSLYQFLVLTFLALTAPISAHLLARAARQRRLPGSDLQD